MKKILITLFCLLALSASCLAETVSFNTKSHKYHNLSCQHSGCKNCVKMEKATAIKKGGVACKVCGG